jgi:hypothetical protein
MVENPIDENVVQKKNFIERRTIIRRRIQITCYFLITSQNSTSDKCSQFSFKNMNFSSLKYYF